MHIGPTYFSLFPRGYFFGAELVSCLKRLQVTLCVDMDKEFCISLVVIQGGWSYSCDLKQSSAIVAQIWETLCFVSEQASLLSDMVI